MQKKGTLIHLKAFNIAQNMKPFQMQKYQRKEILRTLEDVWFVTYRFVGNIEFVIRLVVVISTREPGCISSSVVFSRNDTLSRPTNVLSFFFLALYTYIVLFLEKRRRRWPAMSNPGHRITADRNGRPILNLYRVFRWELVLYESHVSTLRDTSIFEI